MIIDYSFIWSVGGVVALGIGLGIGDFNKLDWCQKILGVLVLYFLSWAAVIAYIVDTVKVREDKKCCKGCNEKKNT